MLHPAENQYFSPIFSSYENNLRETRTCIFTLTLIVLSKLINKLLFTIMLDTMKLQLLPSFVNKSRFTF